jgi:hypothetical protein
MSQIADRNGKYDVAKTLREIEYYTRDGNLCVGFNPFRELVLLCVNAKSEHVRCQGLAELCSYLAPKLKSVEHKGDPDSPFIIKMDFTGNKSYEVIEGDIEGNVMRTPPIT